MGQQWGTTGRAGAGKGSSPRVSTRAALQLEKCEGKSKSERAKRDSVFQLFLTKTPSISTWRTLKKKRGRGMCVCALR